MAVCVQAIALTMFCISGVWSNPLLSAKSWSILRPLPQRMHKPVLQETRCGALALLDWEILRRQPIPQPQSGQTTLG